MIIKLCLALCLALTVGVGHAAASEKLATAADLAQVQLQLQTQGQELAIHKHTLQISLESADKRLADFATLATMQGSHTTWVGNLVAWASILVTILLFFGGFWGYFSVKARAEKEAREAAEQWFIENNRELISRMEQLQLKAKEIENRFSHITTGVENKAEKFHQLIDGISKEANEAAKRVMQSQPDGNVKTDPSKSPVNAQTTQLLQQASDELKGKAEKEFTANEHYVRGASLYASGNFQGALSSFESAIQAAVNASALEQVNYLFAKAITLGGLGKLEEEVKVYNEMDQRFGSDLEPGVREQVVRGLVNKGVSLGEQGKSEETIKVYDEMDRRFGSGVAPGIRALVAKALNGLGCIQIMLAKKNWLDESLRQSWLSSAATVLARATTICGPDDRAMILGNLGYALFLMGQVEAVRAPTLECLKLGGQKALDVQRGDAKQHRVEPEDANYEKLLDELWASLPPPNAK
jgi:tetratricopeptide (TPR) repeat protein